MSFLDKFEENHSILINRLVTCDKNIDDNKKRLSYINKNIEFLSYIMLEAEAYIKACDDITLEDLFKDSFDKSHFAHVLPQSVINLWNTIMKKKCDNPRPITSSVVKFLTIVKRKLENLYSRRGFIESTIKSFMYDRQFIMCDLTRLVQTKIKYDMQS